MTQDISDEDAKRIESRRDFPHHQAAFINSLRVDGTRAEACNLLQEVWNERCYLSARLKEVEAERDEMKNQLDSERFTVECREKRIVRLDARLKEAEEAYQTESDQHDATVARLKEVEAERDRQYDHNAERIVKQAAAEAALATARADALREAYDIILSERVRDRCNDSLWAAAKRVSALIDQPAEMTYEQARAIYTPGERQAKAEMPAEKEQTDD